MMKKTTTLCLFFLMIFYGFAVDAQNLEVRGKVTSADDGLPLPGVSVLIKGQTNGTTTDQNGDYRMMVPNSSAVLVFRFLGFLPQEIRVGNQQTINVNLRVDTKQLSEVVVTALGISRERKALGYAAQSVGAEELNENRQNNLVNSLQGKVSGVTISSTGGAPGQGSSILIRGYNSIDLGRSSEPLFVIDGVLLDNSTFTTGAGAELRGMSNRASDINPDDIENISILKGGAATALYGLRGANGVVVINTKSGKAGKLRVNFTSSFGLDEVNKFPDVQTKYSQGSMGVYDPEQFFPSWGPTIEVAKQLDPTHPDKLFNNYKNAYQQGNQVKNTLSFSGGSDMATFNTSVSQAYQKGVLPFTDYKNLSMRANGDLKFSDKFKVGTSLNFINSGGFRYNADRFNESLTYWSPRWDVTDYVKPDGTMKTYGNGNPIYVASTNRFKDNVNRLIGNLNFNYQPVKWADVNYRIGVDHYTDSRTGYAPGPAGVAGEQVSEDNGLGFINEYRLNFRAINSNLIFGFHPEIGSNFHASFHVGGDLYDRKINRISTEGSELAVYNRFDLGNAKIVTANAYNQLYRLIGIFGEATLDYKDYLFLTLTGRNDITSTLVNPNNSFFYPSVSLGYVFSDQMKMPDFIDYGKLRFSFAGIGKDAEPYSTTFGYATSSDFPIGNIIGFARNTTRGDQNLVPERTNTYEAGTEMQFFDRRFGLDFTWYQSISRNQIIPVAVSNTTGYSNVFVNSGKVRNRGVELLLSGTPVRTTDFNWDIKLNFSANRNKILTIREGLFEIPIASQFGYSGSSATTKLIPGESIGNIYGSYYQRYYGNATEDPLRIDYSKPLVIGANGFPVREPTSKQKILGNYLPKWIGGLTNSINYKSLGLSFLIDVREGVEKYNQFANFMAAFGTAKYTENREDTKVFEGVLADGTPNSKPVWLGQGIGPDGVNYTAGYYRNNYRTATENFVEDASWVRLRSVTLSYDLPKKLFQKFPASGASLSLTGNNLWISTDYSGFDPETSSNPSGSNIGAFSGFTYPAVKSYLVTLNVSF
ncbi:MAG: SusC/RagA family TonB-linked outer membrane protein [Daejeonella sp.]